MFLKTYGVALKGRLSAHDSPPPNCHRIVIFAVNYVTESAIPLFLAVLLHMGLAGMLGVLSRVKRMASGCVGMMCGFLVMSAIVVLGRFAMMVRSVSMMFCGLPMVLGCFFRHVHDLVLEAPLPQERGVCG
jgi:hypothetical protein